ncbi:MAG TPA: POTRA domain-containing protein, partial [Burkholderiales bacterium]|nr:POTRA domain-containing protein [Burkholderiales bacterium]
MIPIADSLRKRLRLPGALAIAFAACTGTAIAQAPGAPRAQAPAAPQSQAPTARRFDIQRFVVEGNTLLSQDDLEQILAPHSGKNRDFGDVQRALEALQGAYSSRGYTAVRVGLPEQDIRAGQVRLQV